MKRIGRNPQETQHKILTAAMKEFATNGYHGARVDNIVKKAGVNKRMVYHYFESKEGLFRTLMEQELEKIQRFSSEEPKDNLYDLVKYWFENSSITDDYFKLFLWIDSFSSVDAPLFENERRELFENSKKIYSEMQDKGELPKDIDPSFYLLAMIALTTLPVVLPGFSKIVTSESPKSTKFQEKYLKVLKLLLEPGAKL